MTDQEFRENFTRIEVLYPIFCNFSRMPYIECDNDTCSDKAIIFTDEENAKRFTESYKDSRQSLSVVTIKKESILYFLASLYSAGFDMIDFYDGDDIHSYTLDQIVNRTLQPGMKKPVENPALQLSIMYFLQIVHIANTEEEREESRDREEEMMANIARAVYMVPFSKREEEEDESVGNKVSLLQLTSGNGETFIPLFTDMDEFLKIRPKEGTTNFLPMGFKQIRTIKLDNTSGFIINPGSTHIQLTESNINAIDLRFGDQAK
ncbi:MAG: SseB family protein [Lachnospiraceae bacterium]|nr:SseB family protein [Lachnospiraceae bacterium]